MELWIRSQDKTTLIRSYEIYISEQQNRYLIRAKRTSHILGIYDTFKRALEVLDEIQNFMLCNREYGYTANVYINELAKCYIYEMPKD